jgi:cation diffusion facilitator family transporter
LSAHCCHHDDHHELADGPQPPGYRRVLWIALLVNALMFGVEIVVGVAAGSMSLLADSLDFFGDAANYGISLAVLGSALAIRARAAILKAATMGLFGAWVLGSSVWLAFRGGVPDAHAMGIVGALALVANVGVAILLYRFRSGDSNMRSVWLCTRNDALGNLAVLAAALGVFGTGTRWPDLIVATIMGTLALTAAWQVIREARHELAHGSVRREAHGSGSSAGLPDASP